MFNGKNSIKSRVFAMVLSVLMILQNVPVTAYAAEDIPVPEGWTDGVIISMSSVIIMTVDVEQVANGAITQTKPSKHGIKER